VRTQLAQPKRLVCATIISTVSGGGGETVLQASMAELVHRPHGVQDVLFVGVIEEIHEVQRSMPSLGELNRAVSVVIFPFAHDSSSYDTSTIPRNSYSRRRRQPGLDAHAGFSPGIAASR
jgi:hypothetical protein